MLMTLIPIRSRLTQAKGRTTPPAPWWARFSEAAGNQRGTNKTAPRDSRINNAIKQALRT